MTDAYNFGTMRLPPLAPAPPMPDAIDIEIVAGNPKQASFDAQTGTVRIEGDDGSVTIETAPDRAMDDGGDHFANLADKIDSSELHRIADELLRGIELDDNSRKGWLETYSRGLDLMGLELRQPSTSTAGGAQLEGTSKVNHPLLKEAVLRGQANARGELLPADGPVKIRDDGENSAASNDFAQALENDLNHYLTTTASEYYPDTDRLLLKVYYCGDGFKKVYRCPIRRRPVSESVDAKDLIVSNAATDLRSCGRITHCVMMRPSTLKRMQMVGAYRDVSLVPGLVSAGNEVDQKINQIQGTQAQSMMDPLDHDRELYECYCELEIKGFEHKEKGKETGLPLPWKVTIDKDSREVLEVRRNWDEDDDMCLPKTVFVKFPFVPGFGFYDIGLLQILGDTTLAATAGWREMLDAGSFSCFPGFLYLKALGKQLTNQFRVPPGGGVPIDAAGAQDIRQAVMPLPYQPPSQAMMQLIQNIVETAQRVGGTADLPVGEGRQDAPVGTTLALIEQATKVIDAVHKRLHQAQSEEFRLLKERFMEDPEALWRHNKKSKVLKLLLAQGEAADPKIAQDEQAHDIANEARKRKFVAALDNHELVPQADPNTSSQMSRIMKAVAVKQLQAANPGLYDARAVDTRILESIGWSDVDSLFAPPAPPQGAPPDPKMITAQAQVMAAQAKLIELQNKAKSGETDAQIEQAKLAVQQRIAELQVQREAIIHANDTALAQRKMQADVLNQHLDRQADLQKHRMGLQADTQMHAGGIVSDWQQHRSGVAADLHKHNSGLAAELHKHRTDLAADLHKHHTSIEAEREAHDRAAAGKRLI